jgi:hypothetical protein
MRRFSTEAPGQGHLWETRTTAVTMSSELVHRAQETHTLFEDAMQNTVPENSQELQSQAATLLALNEKHPLPYFDAARGLMEIGAVRSADDFSFGTEDRCLMMVISRERGSSNFLERALQCAANGKGTDAQAIERAWELLRVLSTEPTDNLACAERLAQIHVDTKAFMPKAVRIFWWKFRKAYAAFCECVESRLTSALPILHMISSTSSTAKNWHDAEQQWRERYAHKTVPA